MTDRSGSTEAPASRSATGDGRWGGGRTIPSGLVAVGGAVMVGALVVAAVWGYMNRQEADRSQATLAMTQAELSTTQSELAAAEERATTLSECVDRSQAATQEAQMILDLEEHRYALLQTGSAWATAYSAREQALLGAIADYYQGFLAAYNGNQTSANTAIQTGTTKTEAAKTEANTMNSEIAKVGDVGNSIAQRMTAFKASTANLAVACAE